MAVRMEIRCDNAECRPAQQPGPHLHLASDDARSVSSGLRDLKAAARAMGWRRTTSGWRCPNCLRPSLDALDIAGTA